MYLNNKNDMLKFLPQKQNSLLLFSIRLSVLTNIWLSWNCKFACFYLYEGVSTNIKKESDKIPQPELPQIVDQ